jgi:site-specific recombinase XerD
MTSSVAVLADPTLLLQQFLTGYWSARTRANYAFIIGGWFTWCADRAHDPLRDADPRVLERWITDMQQRPYAANTIAARVSAVSAFYRWCVREQLLDRNPVVALAAPTMQAIESDCEASGRCVSAGSGRSC